MTRRVLFFPSCGGQGFGHLSRCRILAAAMQRRGWDARLCVTPEKARLLKDAGVPLIQREHLVYSSPHKNTAPAYICLTNGNLQVLRDGFTSFLRVARSVREAEQAIQSFQPDILVGDLSLIAGILGQRRKIPVVQMVRSIIHPQAAKIFWWREPPPGSVPPDIRMVFNPLLRWWNLPGIAQAEDLMRGDLYLVPSIPSLDPLPDGVKNTYYTGALLDASRRGVSLPANFPRRSAGPVVYVTLGTGTSQEQSAKIFSALHNAFSGSKIQVVISTGKAFDRSRSSIPHNFSYFDWLPGQAAIAASDAVIYHGGQNTTLELAVSGTPALVLPTQSEQESNGRRLEQYGAGRVLSPLDDPSMVQVLRGRWRYGVYQTCVVPEYVPSADALHAAVTALLDGSAYREQAKLLRAETAEYRGVDTALDLLERL